MPPHISPQIQRRATYSAMALHFLMGVANATWFSRMPAIRDALELTPAEIGLILLVGSIGSLVALPSTGPLSNVIGTRNTVRLGATAWAAGLGGMGLGVMLASRPMFAVGLILMTFGGSMWVSSMNIEVGYHESVAQRPIQFQFHASYTVGAVLGALVAAAIIRLGVAVPYHVWGIAVIGLLAAWYGSFLFLPQAYAQSFGTTADGSRRIKGRTRRAWTERTTILIAILALAGGLLEGSANEWLSLAMVDGYGMDQSHASMAYSLFLIVMATVRMCSAFLLRRFPVEALVRSFFIGAVVGLVAVAFSPVVGGALLGGCLWAAGTALVFPASTSALSSDPSMTAARISVLSTINYASALVGPPVLGLVAQAVGYHRMLAVLVVPVMIGIFLTPQLVRSRSTGQD